MFGGEGCGLRKDSFALPHRIGQRREAAVKLARRAVPAAVLLALALAPAAWAQDARPAVPPIEERVAAFAARLEAKRKELGVVGAAVVVAQRDRIVWMAGLGQRKADAPEPVTEDTVFPIASVTKQFTAIGVALAVGEGKMAFEDHPRKYVPEFRLKDPDADAKINLIDLLAHRSGLDRSDLIWLNAPFTQAELFAIAARARPVAKLRERHIYNNTMYSLAGAALARAYGTTYEAFMLERMLKPLGMASSTLTLAAFAASANRVTGYMAPTAGVAKLAKPANPAAIAPAGAINSTARDMGNWLKFLNARGQTAGLKVAPAAFARVFENQFEKGSPYGLGIALETRSGVLLAEHAGNLPGFTAQVAYVPDRALSMALLTNQNESPLAAVAKELFWELVVQPELPAAAQPKPERARAPAPPASGPQIVPELLTGQYFGEGAGLEVRKLDTGLITLLPGLPALPLKAAGINVYEMVGAGGVMVHFAPSATMPGRITLLLVLPQSQGGQRISLVKKDSAWLARARAQHKGPHTELIGSYRSTDRKATMEIVPYKDGLALNPGEALRMLVHAGSDLFRLEGRPETHRLQIKRAGAGQVMGFTLEEPKSKTEMISEGLAGAGDASRAREILARAAAAAGGAEALDRIASFTAIGRASAPTQGIDGPMEERIVPGKRAVRVALGAFGKFLRYGAVSNERSGSWTWVDGERRESTGKALDAARLFAVPHPLYRWKERFDEVAALGETAVNGENAYVIELTARGLAPAKLYISAVSGLILRLETPVYLGDALITSNAEAFSDYRTMQGIRLPFTVSSTISGFGELVLSYDSVTLGAQIDPKVFE